MSSCILISPSRSLIDEVAGRLDADGQDFSKHIVVFPGKRPAHFLRRALARRLGRSFIPPRTYSIDDFIDYVYREKLDVQRKELEAIDAVALLHRIHNESPERIGGNSFESLDGFLPLGLRLFNELEELSMANVPQDMIDQKLAALTYGNSHLLSRFFNRFYQEAERGSYCTRSLKYKVVADRLREVDWNSFDGVLFAGFFALTTLEKSIFTRFLELPNTLFVFQKGKGLKRHLDDIGVRPERIAGEEAGPDVHFYRNSDSHGQMFVLSNMLKQARDTGQPMNEKTAIVLPAAENLFPFVNQALTQFDDDEYNISLGYPVTRTPVYGFLHRLMELISSVHDGALYVPEYVNFLLHPYTKNIRLGHRSDVTRIAVHAIEEYFTEHTLRTFFSLEELENDDELFEGMLRKLSGVGEGLSIGMLKSHLKGIHDRTIRQLMSFENIGDCAQKCVRVLEYVYDQSTAERHPLFRPFAEALIAALDEISRSLLHAEHFDDAVAYFTFLRRSIAAGMIPFQGTPVRGLQVLGFLETRNLKFDTVYLLDVNDENIPGSAPQDTLLPQKVRESIGLATYRDREEVASYYFDVLLKGADQVYLFFTENGTNIKSRFVEQLLWDQEKRAAKQSGSAHSRDAGVLIRSTRYSLRLGSTTPEEISKSAEVADYLQRFAYNASALDTYLKCPLKFYYTYVLKLEQKQEVTDEIERSDLGILVHKILAQLFRGRVGQLLEKATIEASPLDSIVEDEFVQYFGAEITASKYLLKAQIRKQLKNFLADYQIPMIQKEPVKLIGIELELRLKKSSYNLKGFLDRVETRSGKTFILDYKTGSNDTRLKINFKKLAADDPTTWRDAIGSLQLPLYILLYSQAYGEKIENIVPAYLLLGKNLINNKIEVKPFDELNPAAGSYQTLEMVILSLLDEITDLNQPFRPTDDFEQHCPNCPFQSMCGTQWVQTRNAY